MVLLKPNFSSIIKILYNEKGKFKISLPKKIIPKKLKLISSSDSNTDLTKLSINKKPSKKKNNNSMVRL